MVLFIRLVAPAKGERPSERTYQASQVGRAVVFHAPTDEPLEDLALVMDLQDRKHPHFVTPCAGVMTEQQASATRPSTAGSMVPLVETLSEVRESIAARENVTFINRGVRSADFYASLVWDVVHVARDVAENAIQLVAEEIAKERQMLRLLQMERGMSTMEDVDGSGEERAQSQKASIIAGTKTADAVNGAQSLVALSGSFCASMRKLRAKYPHLLSSTLSATYSPMSTDQGSGNSNRGPPAGGVRFVVFASSYVGELVPPSQGLGALLPEAFVTRPLVSKGEEKREPSKCSEKAGKGRKQTRASFGSHFRHRRRSTMAVLKELQAGGDAVEGEVTAISGNGWGSDMTVLELNGSSSVLTIPGVPNFEEVIRNFSVDFWLRTDCKVADGKRILLQIMDPQQRMATGQLFQVGLNWFEDQRECIRLYIRDSANRVLECILLLSEPAVTSGLDFHHVMIHVRSLEEGKVEGFVDGCEVAVQYVQQERPIAFSPWPHRLSVGGYVDESGVPCQVLRGSICELRFWGREGVQTPVVCWPLANPRAGGGVDTTLLSTSYGDSPILKELSGATLPDHRETIMEVQRTVCKTPAVCPRFDGNLVVNLGTIPILGELLFCWGVEIRFRTDCTSRVMTLLGVTDEQCRKQSFGIVLNAEPLTSKERFQFHERNVTLYLTDAMGASCSALLRGSDRRSVMDGAWHTLHWRCVNSESNSFEVKLDGVAQDLLYVLRESPSCFVPFNNWVALGGHNERNWKVVRPFLGDVSRLCVTARGRPVVHLTMAEGPGSSVMQDVSGYANHGILTNLHTRKRRRLDVVWVPCGEAASSGEAEKVQTLDVFIHKNNQVSVAAVVFSCDFTPSGVPYEVIVDILSGETLRLYDAQPSLVSAGSTEEVSGGPAGSARWGGWWCIPDPCFRRVDAVTQLEEAIGEALERFRHTEGHAMLVVRVGDCNITLLNLVGPTLPSEALYDRNMLKWHYRYAVEGTAGRRAHLLNQMIEGVESVLLGDTMTPFLTAKLGPANVREAPIATNDLITALHSCGKPWFLPAVLQNQLLNVSSGSALHIIHHCESRMNVNAAASVGLFNQALYAGSANRAAVIIQRNWKIWVARKHAAQLAGTRLGQERQLDEVRAIRMNPVVHPKRDLYALVITLHDVAAALVKPIRETGVEIVDLLRRQGYVVDHLVNPDRSAVIHAVSTIDSNRSNFIYLSGYGGPLQVRQPPSIGLQRMHVAISEGAERAAICLEQGEQWRSLLQGFARELSQMPPPKKRKGGPKKSVPGRSKKLNSVEEELLKRHTEEALRTVLQDLSREEADQRALDLDAGWELEMHALLREFKNTIAATKAFESAFLAAPSDEAALQPQYIYPVEATTVQPYGPSAIRVDEILRRALHTRLPPLGLQCLVAVDLAPITPHARGFACLASSTSYQFDFHYQPEQRHLLTQVLTKALHGHFPRVIPSGHLAPLHGSIETPAHQRDWKSLATYVVGKMQVALGSESMRPLREELAKEVPFTAEFVPIRATLRTKEMIERQRREQETAKATVRATFAVDAPAILSDAVAEFKAFITHLSILEATFMNAILITFGGSNRGVDGLRSAVLSKAINAVMPDDCRATCRVEISAGGAQVTFVATDPSDRILIGQWIATIIMRGMSWRLPIDSFYGTQALEVATVELLYAVKCIGTLRECQRLLKQRYRNPIPTKSVRFLSCDLS